MKYVVSDYFATGEGRTLSILITRDRSKKEIMQEFIDLFDAYYAIGLEFVEREELVSKYNAFLPSFVMKKLEQGYPVEYFGQIHFNIS